MQQKAKIAICAAFKNGFDILTYIVGKNYAVEFVATSAQDNSEYENMIADLCRRNGIRLLRKADANSAEFAKQLMEKEIDLVFLAWWPSIIKENSIRAAKKGWVNLHPSLLPYNRGKHPYYWSIVDGTPFGVTLHFIDAGIDTGDILYQEPVEVLATDTGESLYRKGNDSCLALFKKHFDAIVNFEYETKKQRDEMSTMHYAKDIAAHSTIDLEKTYKAIDLINIIRARTFFGGDSSCFYIGDKKYLLRLSIVEADD